MPEEHNDIEQLFRDTFQEGTETPPPGLFEEIVNTPPSVSTVGSVPKAAWIGSASLLFVGLISYIFIAVEESKPLDTDSNVKSSIPENIIHEETNTSDQVQSHKTHIYEQEDESNTEAVSTDSEIKETVIKPQKSIEEDIPDNKEVSFDQTKTEDIAVNDSVQTLNSATTEETPQEQKQEIIEEATSVPPLSPEEQLMKIAKEQGAVSGDSTLFHKVTK